MKHHVLAAPGLLAALALVGAVIAAVVAVYGTGVQPAPPAAPTGPSPQRAALAGPTAAVGGSPDERGVGPQVLDVLAVPTPGDLVVSRAFRYPSDPRPGAENVPDYPGSSGSPGSTTVSGGTLEAAPLDTFRYDGYDRHFTSGDSLEDVTAFYTRTLQALGWTPLPDPTEDAGAGGAARAVIAAAGSTPDPQIDWSRVALCDCPPRNQPHTYEWWARHSRLLVYSWEDSTGAFPYRMEMRVDATEYVTGTVSVWARYYISPHLTHLRVYPGAKGIAETAPAEGYPGGGPTRVYTTVRYEARASAQEVRDYYITYLKPNGYSAVLKRENELWFYFNYPRDESLGPDLKLVTEGDGQGGTRVRIDARVPGPNGE